MFLQTPVYVLGGLAESLLFYYRCRIRLQPSSAEHEVGHPTHLARNGWYWVLACLGLEQDDSGFRHWDRLLLQWQKALNG